MVSEDKVRQIISSLKETSVYSFDLEQFKQLLTLLNKLELALFKETLIKDGETTILSQYELIEEEVYDNIDRKIEILENGDDEETTIIKVNLDLDKADYTDPVKINDYSKYVLANKHHVILILGYNESSQSYTIAEAKGKKYGVLISNAPISTLGSYRVVDMSSYYNSKVNGNYENDFESGRKG